IAFNMTIINPNQTKIDILKNGTMIPENYTSVTPVSVSQPSSILIDFPIQGIWQFNVSWNVSTPERLKARLSSFEPPIFIESITKENNTFYNQSAIFFVNVTNKNPFSNFTNITPYLLGNFSNFNISSEWDPSTNCSEGYYDAVAQGVSLDFRINTVTVNQTISTIILSQGTTIVLKYSYNRQDFDTLKWTGFFITLGLLMSFLGVYVTAQAYHLRSITNKVRNRLFPDRSIINLALQEKGISMSPDDLNAVIDSTTDLDQFAENIFNLTGQRLSPEDLLSITSGATLEQIIQRLSRATNLSPEAVASQLKDASSVEELMVDLNLDRDLFLDIIAKDEQVTNFQARIATYIQPIRREMSSIISNDEIDVIRFRERMKKEIG
ncbi:MAG: hypothetical protein ACTSQH_09820, partial [Candidatus Hodarchaeales archaeon]